MRLDRFGLEVEVHKGWDARLLRRAPSVAGETAHPLLHLASRRMPIEVLGDYGSHVVDRLTHRDAFIALKEFDRALVGTALYDHPVPWPLHADQANPKGLQRVLAGQSGLQHFFTHRGRAFCLYVVLGSHAHRHRTVPLVNTVLAGVRIT